MDDFLALVNAQTLANAGNNLGALASRPDSISFTEGYQWRVVGAGDWTKSATQSYVHATGQKQVEIIPLQLDKPTPSPAAGTYTSAQSVSLSCSKAGATIRYTTDGSDPTETSDVYSAPIDVTATTTIKAKAFKTAMTPSEITTALYTLRDPVLPIIISPTADKIVKVAQGNPAALSVTAQNATAYQWYINRNDGKGFVAISGATGASHSTSAVAKNDSGYQYRCVVSNEDGNVTSPVFTLSVVAGPAPATGDRSAIGLWIGLLLLAGAGMVLILKKRSA